MAAPDKVGTWGGKRPGAGRKPKGLRAGVSHRNRPEFETPTAVFLTLRTSEWVPSLDAQEWQPALGKALDAGADRFGFKVLKYGVKGPCIHVLAEAESTYALFRGVQGLSIRIAKGLNAAMGSKGKFFADRYECQVLATPEDLLRVSAEIDDLEHARALLPASEDE